MEEKERSNSSSSWRLAKAISRQGERREWVSEGMFVAESIVMERQKQSYRWSDGL